MNELRFGINQWDEGRLNPRTDSDFDLDSLGIGEFRVAGDNNRKLSPGEAGVPSIGFTIGDPNPRINDTISYQLSENLTVIRGSHNFKMGGQYYRSEMDRLAANLTRGRLSFGGEAYVFQQNGDLFNRIAVHVLHEDRLSIVVANDGSVKPGLYLAQSSAASLNRVLKAQAASGMRADVHVHADGTVHASH